MKKSESNNKQLTLEEDYRVINVNLKELAKYDIKAWRPNVKTMRIHDKAKSK